MCVFYSNTKHVYGRKNSVQTQMFRHKKRGICTAVHLCTLMQKPLLSGDGGIRTHDLYTASVALSQLSYAPESDVSVKTLPIIQENTRSFNIFFSKTSKIRESQIRASNS